MTHINGRQLESMWTKVESLLSVPGHVLPAAGQADTARQAVDQQSSAGKSPPLHVTTKRTMTGIAFQCSCFVYRSSPNLCQHCIAAAEDMGMLEEYLQWVRSSKKTACNISQLLADSIARDSGRKGKGKRKVGTRKSSKQVEVESFEENPRLLATNPTHKRLDASDSMPVSPTQGVPEALQQRLHQSHCAHLSCKRQHYWQL